MRVYIQTDNKGEFFNVNAFNAFVGFKEFGWEILKFHQVEEITDNNLDTLVVGGIGNVLKRLELLGIKKDNPELDYPTELEKYFGRKIWKSTLQTIFDDESSWNIFIKPREFTKKFTGKVFNEYADFVGVVNSLEPIPVWCSEVVQFVTEWRCFIRYGEILDIRRYKGAWDSKIDLKIVESAVTDFTTAPKAFGMDFGIDEKGDMQLVECNDGHSLGGYGISPTNYAKFLSARWAEMTKTEDYLHF